VVELVHLPCHRHPACGRPEASLAPFIKISNLYNHNER
jgi:hypothetical protein